MQKEKGDKAGGTDKMTKHEHIRKQGETQGEGNKPKTRAKQ